MNTKATALYYATVGLLLAFTIAVIYGVIWLAVIFGVLIVVSAGCFMALCRKANQEEWKRRRMVSRALNEIEQELFDELHRELAGIKQDKPPVSNVHPGSRISDKYIAMIEGRDI